MASSLMQAEQVGATPGRQVSENVYEHVYEDFEIEIGCELAHGRGNQYPVSVIRSPAGKHDPQ